MPQKTRSFAVIGLGAFGATVAGQLAEFGNYVLGVDIDEKAASAMTDTLSEVIIADGSDENALKEAGVGSHDVAVVAIGEDLQANILCTMNVKMLGVKTVWVKAFSRTHHRILHKLGADRVIRPEHEIGHHIAQSLHNPLVEDYLNVGGGHYVVNLTIPEDYTGQPLSALKLEEKHGLRAMGVIRDGDFFDREGAAKALKKGDKVLLLGKRPNLRKFGDMLNA